MSQSSWREVVDPETRKVMFVNIDTGGCTWKPPEDELPVTSSPSDWWEFIDQQSTRHYYYQLETGKCQWRRPRHGNIVFMAKLQDSSVSSSSEDTQTKASEKLQKKPLPTVPPKPTPYFKSRVDSTDASVAVGVVPLPVEQRHYRLEARAVTAEAQSKIQNIVCHLSWEHHSTHHTEMESVEDLVEAPVWLNDFKYDICLIHSDRSSFADELTGHLKDLAVRCYRHYPSLLADQRQDNEDINDEQNVDPARSSIEDTLKSSKFFMFIFSRDFLDTDSQFDHGDSEGVILEHFAPDDPVHTNIELPNLLPILDGTALEELKKYSKAMGSKIPINTTIGAKRLSEMFFKKLTGQMPTANFKLQDYLKKKKKNSS